MTLPEHVRRALEKWLDEVAGGRPAGGTPAPEAAEEGEGAGAIARPVRAVDMRGVAAALADRVGGELGEEDVGEVVVGAEEIAEIFGRALGGGAAVALDLETLGLRSCAIFLAGVMDLDSGEARIAIARTYAAEGALIEWLGQQVEGAASLATFNGAAFDLPLLRERAALWGVALRLPAKHTDLLHVVRGRYELSSYRLAAVEEQLLGRTRLYDVEASALPEIYHAYVESGRGEDIACALAHNLADLVALAELYALLREDEQEGQ